MPITALAPQFTGEGKITFVDHEYDDPGRGQLLLRVEANAICGTDRDQYHAGALLPVREAQPGDLIFLANDPSNPDTIHHVMMFLGDGKVVEAQQTGVPVHTRSFSFDEAEVVPQAVRPGV